MGMNDYERKMRLVINDAELAIGNFVELAEKFSEADGSIMIKVKLSDVRQLVDCYPALNAIVNNPDFNCN